MKVGIVGVGAIGMLLAGYLGQKHDIHIYSKRFEMKRDQSRVSITVKREDHVLLVEAETHQKLVELSDMDLIFICVKQTGIDEVVNSIRKLDFNPTLIFIQNGMTHLEKIKVLPQTIYLGVVEHGAKRIGENEVIHSGQGQIKLGLYKQGNQNIINLTDTLSREAFPIYNHDHIIEVMHEKLIVNAVINPLTALFHVKNKAVIDNNHLVKLAQAICLEATEILNMDYAKNWGNVSRIARDTGENTSSMLQDIKAGRLTEVESILGYLLAQSKIESPYIDFAYQAILAKESGV